MVDIAITWRCPRPKCDHVQNTSIRFKTDEQLNDIKIVQRYRKKRYTCFYCGKTFKSDQVSYRRLNNMQDAKNIVAILNKENEKNNSTES